MPYLTRITFNSNSWELPSGRGDKCENHNLFEAIHGFGFEEWWRNENFRLVEDGKIFQYGFLQSLNVLNVKPRVLDVLYLYTKYNGLNRIVAKLTNVVILDQNNICNALKDCFEVGHHSVSNQILNVISESAQRTFLDGPFVRDESRCYFNFKIDKDNIEFYNWDNGLPVQIKNHRFKLLNFYQ